MEILRDVIGATEQKTHSQEATITIAVFFKNREFCHT